LQLLAATTRLVSIIRYAGAVMVMFVIVNFIVSTTVVRICSLLYSWKDCLDSVWCHHQ